MLNLDLTVVCKTEEVLARLRSNRAQHAALVKEAREGYVDAARAELERRLEKLRSGKLVAVHVQMTVPLDYTSTYDTVINMLMAHTGETVELAAAEFRQLMEDKWDWWGQFAGSNARYSSSTRALVESEEERP